MPLLTAAIAAIAAIAIASCSSSSGGGGGNNGTTIVPANSSVNVAPTNTGGAVQSSGATTNVALIGEPIAVGVLSSGGHLVSRSGFYPDVPPPASTSSNQ